jgi:hypothetical protein
MHGIPASVVWSFCNGKDGKDWAALGTHCLAVARTHVDSGPKPISRAESYCNINVRKAYKTTCYHNLFKRTFVHLFIYITNCKMLPVSFCLLKVMLPYSYQVVYISIKLHAVSTSFGNLQKYG